MIYEIHLNGNTSNNVLLNDLNDLNIYKLNLIIIILRYPIARSKKRKIIFHAGPTNSGKTYQALQRFISAKSGVYCGPLKLLANEVFNKCNFMVSIKNIILIIYYYIIIFILININNFRVHLVI